MMTCRVTICPDPTLLPFRLSRNKERDRHDYAANRRRHPGGLLLCRLRHGIPHHFADSDPAGRLHVRQSAAQAGRLLRRHVADDGHHDHSRWLHGVPVAVQSQWSRSSMCFCRTPRSWRSQSLQPRALRGCDRNVHRQVSTGIPRVCLEDPADEHWVHSAKVLRAHLLLIRLFSHRGVTRLAHDTGSRALTPDPSVCYSKSTMTY